MVVRPSAVSEKWHSRGSWVLSSSSWRSLGVQKTTDAYYNANISVCRNFAAQQTKPDILCIAHILFRITQNFYSTERHWLGNITFVFSATGAFESSPCCPLHLLLVTLSFYLPPRDNDIIMSLLDKNLLSILDRSSLHFILTDSDILIKLNSKPLILNFIAYYLWILDHVCNRICVSGNLYILWQQLT